MINQYHETIETENVKPLCITLLHGESALLTFSLTREGEPIALTNFTCKFYYNTKEQENKWYEANATIDARENIVSVNWLPTMDDGSPLFNWFVRLQGTTSTDISYRICGKFMMLNSPNFVPNTITLPKQVLDFSDIEVLNSPYYTKAETDEAFNSVDTRLNGHDREIDAGRESLQQHEANHNNPHRVNVEQLTSKSADAGRFKFEYSETDNHPWGYTDFNFDPAMFNRGEVYLTALYNGTPLPFSAMVHRLELPNFGNSLIFRSDEKYYISDGEYYIDWILNNINSDDFTFGLSINPNDEFDNFDGWQVLVTSETNPVANKEYKQGGTYKVLTEAMLRDEVTGIAYTLKVSNGELHLVEYREESFEG